MDNKNILFINNYKLFEIYQFVFEALANNGYDINILSFDGTNISWAKQKKYKIFVFNVNKIESNKKNYIDLSWDWSTKFERESWRNNFTLVNKKILFIQKIIDNLNPNFILGEKTWPHERYTYRYAKEKKINYLSLVSLRRPSELHFFSHKYEDPFINVKQTITKKELNRALKIISKPKKVDYKWWNQTPNIKERILIIMRYIYKSIFRKSTVISIFLQLKLYLSILKNRLIIKSSKKCKSSKFCYFVHVEPEASVYLLGAGMQNNDHFFDWVNHYYSVGKINFLGLDNFISYKVPYFFYGRFKNLNRIARIWPRLNISSIEALKNGIIPITISGTIALEALSKGIKPIILGKPYFRKFKNIYIANSAKEFSNIIKKDDFIIKNNTFKEEYYKIASFTFNVFSKESCKKFIDKNHIILSKPVYD